MKLSKIFLLFLLVLPAAIFAMDNLKVTHVFEGSDKTIEVSFKATQQCAQEAEEAFKKCEKERSRFVSYVQTCKEIQAEAFLKCLKTTAQEQKQEKEKHHKHGPGCKHAHKKGLSEGRHI